MSDWFLRTYIEMLEALPIEQRTKFQQFVGIHGLKPDDPSIVCVMLNFLLVRKLTDRLKNVEDALDSQNMKRGIAYVAFFTKIAQKSSTIACAFAIVTILLCAGIAWMTHNVDQSAEHERACADERVWTVRLVDDAHKKGYLRDTYGLINLKPPDC